MDCSKSIILINALADGELKDKQKQELLLHITGCAKCSVKYNEVVKIKQLLERAPEMKAPSDFLAKLHSKMEKENIIVKKESIIKIFINAVNRPIVLRPALAVILSVIIIAVYRPHEFLSENFKTADSFKTTENRNEYPVEKQDHKDFKPSAAVKKETQAKKKKVTDSLQFSDSNREINNVEKDDNSPVSAMEEKHEDKKIMESEGISASQKSKSGMFKSSEEEAPVSKSSMRKSRAESSDKAKGDEFFKPSGSSIDSIINKYQGKILYRDNNKISISLPFNKSDAFFDDITGSVSKYIITGKKSDFIFIDLILKK